MKEALASGKVHRYVTDFATPDMIGVPGAIPRFRTGASTEESEDNCAVMAAMELDDYRPTETSRTVSTFLPYPCPVPAVPAYASCTRMYRAC